MDSVMNSEMVPEFIAEVIFKGPLQMSFVEKVQPIKVFSEIK